MTTRVVHFHLPPGGPLSDAVDTDVYRYGA
jgi:hypothetical protein